MSSEIKILTPTQVQKLRETLVCIKLELEEMLQIASSSSEVVELDQPIGRLSRMDAISRQQMAKASRSRVQLRLRQVEAALRRDPEDYGYCVTCDEPIGFGRLSVRPEAPFCVACQSANER